MLFDTDHCIFALKKVIQYYKSNNSPVYSCFLDASKAFDRVNHWTLFRKLLNRGVPVVLIRILLYWYRTQTFCVKWGSTTSEFFNVSNGVRQNVTTVPWVLNYICFMHIVVQLIVANYWLTLIRDLI